MRLNPNSNIGAALRDIREARGLSLDDIADVTRVRPGYLAAIEAFDLGALPSRPFAIGYVRAYAQALGLDGDAAVSRFKAEAPSYDNELRTPIGVRHNRPRRFGAVAAVAGVMLAALVGWNVARHAMAEAPQAPAPKVVRHLAVLRPAVGPSQIGAPLPPPPEADTPKTYQTPFVSGDAPPQPVNAAPPAPPADLGGPFVAQGPVYGAAAPGAGVILQAKGSTSLVVRGAGGAVYFAKQLSPGEAWRAPAIKGLIVEASSPNSVEAYVGGVSKGLLADPQTPLSKFGV
ncbi:MAG TPA: helix-turn-helix domain-containing protein [Caulobacteraceae bacterium]|nr:helix-turn-helix domain-containing protein [Caulobacteraceae bacterium]